MTDVNQSAPTASGNRIKNKIPNGRERIQKHIILAAYLNGEPLNESAKLQNIMFILSDVVKDIKDDCSYHADMYGPHSDVVDYELDDLTEKGVLRRVHNKIETTPMGRDIAKELIKSERQEIVHLLSRYKEFLNDLTYNESFAYFCLA